VTQQVWDCAETRISLGVYVLGAIDPAERAMVDAHLVTCRDCRDELAGLASLPALLARVNPEELSRIEAEVGTPDAAEPPPELIGTVLDLAAARRRRSRWRYAAAAAAVVALAGGIFGGLSASHPASSPAAAFSPGTGGWDKATASSTATGATAAIYYSGEDWGTAFAVKVSGIPDGTTCKMWVTYSNGVRAYVTAWMTGEDEGKVYYWGSLPSTPAGYQLASFEITTGKQTLVNVPA
jgi:predicted anti-sigma-YlaC factor YlaD